MTILAVVACAHPYAAVAQQKSGSQREICQRVDKHYNHLTSLRVRYSERYTGMGMDRTETGTLLLRKPGRMLWRYDQPAGKVFVLDGKYAWSYTPGDVQAQRIPAKQLDDLHSPLRFLLGHTQLERELDNLQITQATASSYVIRGVPRGGPGRLKELLLRVAADGSIQSMRLEEQDGAATTFTFSSVEENVPAPDSAFRFVPPPGVGVMDGLPPA